MMKIRYLALLLTIVSFGGTATTDISELEKKITTLGPKKTIAQLYANNEKEWLLVTSKIAQGDQSWLQLAAQLAPGADADSAESLSSALGLAIPHNPTGVLAITSERYPPLAMANVCSLPFYSMNEIELNQYVVDAIRALYKVPNGKACLDKIISTIGQSDGYREDN
ncbi:hypothetical protein [Erwinia sp. B116]|uniref:hypothetical protein n=1 Tax=Erwinia sp. B116 TaxID=1561024 RepID=UPI000C767951|nr:hypothetical protein [Erwinia sp. B116]PLV61924.1 hypothetical protein NV64_07505 [Erwinia sp. B116]